MKSEQIWSGFNSSSKFCLTLVLSSSERLEMPLTSTEKCSCILNIHLPVTRLLRRPGNTGGSREFGLVTPRGAGVGAASTVTLHSVCPVVTTVHVRDGAKNVYRWLSSAVFDVYHYTVMQFQPYRHVQICFWPILIVCKQASQLQLVFMSTVNEYRTL